MITIMMLSLSMVPLRETRAGTPTLEYYPTGHNFGENNQGEIGFTKFYIWSGGTCGDDMLFYTLTSEADWLTVRPTNGSCTCGEIDTLQLKIDTTGLPSGFHNASIQITSNGGTGVFTVRVFIRNNPPSPPVVSGTRLGQADAALIYTCTSDDPEGDTLFYNISWGDGTYSGWHGPYLSGEHAELAHQWTQGTYIVQGKARDEKGAESNWSDPLRVVMPRSFSPLFTHLITRLRVQGTSCLEKGKDTFWVTEDHTGETMPKKQMMHGG